MDRGDTVIYGRRRLVVVGLDPMSVSDPLAEVEDPSTGEILRVPLAALEPDAPVSSADP